ncbi:hypothetical protein Q9Q95_09455 [Sphingomonas sp. DG1-23]|uniref:hypothetical protein n=1 Tax=Sphingomonas sp. DG1-23 TaxID=3068316 RepID=UPI00273E0365|nr:hypothetical protein [Sphingomonas sp. DG1-23]MDP5279150.1 hypothetical protein [Sphingomonas sp. DG1-23]
MRKLFAAAVAAVFGLIPATAEAGFTTASTVVGVDVGDSGVLYIRFADSTFCGSPLVYVPRTAVYYSDALAIALSALSTGKKLAVWIPACEGTGAQLAVRFVHGQVW